MTSTPEFTPYGVTPRVVESGPVVLAVRDANGDFGCPNPSHSTARVTQKGSSLRCSRGHDLAMPTS